MSLRDDVAASNRLARAARDLQARARSRGMRLDYPTAVALVRRGAGLDAITTDRVVVDPGEPTAVPRHH